MTSLKIEHIQGVLIVVCCSLVLSNVTASITGPVYFQRNGQNLLLNGTTTPQRCRITNQLSYPMSAPCNWTYETDSIIKMYGEHRYVSHSGKTYALYRDPSDDHFLLLILQPKTFDDETRFACTYYVLRNTPDDCFWTTPCEIQAERETNVTCSRNDINYLTKKISIPASVRLQLHERYEYTTAHTTIIAEEEERPNGGHHDLPPSHDYPSSTEETNEKKRYNATTNATTSPRPHTIGTMDLQTPQRVRIDTNSTSAANPRLVTNATTSVNEQKSHSNVVIAWAYTILLTAPFFAAIYVTLLVIATNRRRRRYGRMEINPSTERTTGTSDKTREIREYMTTV